MKNGVTETKHPEPEELRLLHIGRLSSARTELLNRHKLRCETCREEYEKIALAEERPSPPEELKALFKKVMARDRGHARDEARISTDRPIEMRRSELDGALAALGDEEASRFIVTGGRLKSVMEDVRKSLEKIGDRKTLTPEGERSFVSFLASCLEANAENLSAEGKETGGDSILEMLDALGEMASSISADLQDVKSLKEARTAFNEKIQMLKNKFCKKAGGA